MAAAAAADVKNVQEFDAENDDNEVVGQQDNGADAIIELKKLKI